MAELAMQAIEQRLRRAEAERPTEFECLGRRFALLDGVFPPTHFQSTAIFTRSLEYVAGTSFFELGCGAGVTAVTAALEGCAPVVASDISSAAVRNTRLNVERHGLADIVSVRTGDLFDVLQPGERFDVIFWNSNFVFVPDGYVFDKPYHRAFCDPGYASHDRFLREAPRHLNPGGRLLLGFSSQGDAAALEQLLAKHRYTATTLVSAKGAGPEGHRYDVVRLTPL